MTAALLAAVVFVLVVAAAGALRHRLADERSSVRDYQHTIDTLRHLSDRRALADTKSAATATPTPLTSPADATAPPVSQPSATAAPQSASASHPPGRTDGQRRRPEPPSRRPRRPRRTTTLLASSAGRGSGRSAVLASRSGPPAVSMRVEAPPEDPVDDPPSPVSPAPSPTGASGPVGAADTVRRLAAARNLRGQRSVDRSMPAANHAQRRAWLWTAAAVVVIGVITGVAVAEAPSHPSSSGQKAAKSISGVGRRATPSPRQRANPSSSKAKAPGKASTVPPHNVPAGLVAISSSSTAATYEVSDAPFTVTVATSGGPCWLEATDSSDGQLLWEGTLAPGESQAIASPAGLVLRLGNSPVTTVTEGGQVVSLPAGAAVVFDLTFQVA